MAVWAAIAFLSGLAAVLTWQWSGASANWVAHTLIVQQQLSKTLIAAQDMETGQRGYLLTGDEQYLEPYVNAKAALPEINGALDGLVGDNGEQLSLINQIQTAMTARFVIIDQSIALMRAGRTAGAQDVVKSGEGKLAMDKLRALIATAQQQEQHLFETRQASFNTQRVWLLGALLAMLLSCSGLALLALVREKDRVTQLEKAGDALVELNKTLESRVGARTSELAIERDRAEAERERAEALLRDVTHRIGNTLALVVGFINLHIRHARDPLSIKTLTGARSRIHAIASAQRRINVTNDLDLVRIDDLMPSVLADLVAASGESSVEVKVEIAPLLAPAQAATSLCVLTQEFVMNSLKHAFAGGQPGVISVKLERPEDGGALLTISDNGSGMPKMQESDDAEGDVAAQNGLGSKIATLLTRQFNGSIDYAPASDDAEMPGTKVTVRLPDLKLAPADVGLTLATASDAAA